MMLNPDSPIPLYEQVKDYLLQKITSGELPPHSKIPSERSLSQQFGINRLTASKAIKELVLEGKLYTKVGKGTYVNDAPISQTIGSLTSFTQDMASRGQRPASRVLQAEIVEANATIAQKLSIPIGTNLIALKRVRMANQLPIALEMSYVIESYCANILDNHDFAKESLYRVLQTEYNLHLAYAEQVFEARAASTDEAKILEIKGASPVLHITRVTYLQGDRPIEYVESAYRGDRYKFKALLQHI